MKVSKEELIPVLAQFNPWWRKESISDLPSWKRSIYNELKTWVFNPPAKRAIMLSGARQVGKTTLLLQVIDELIKTGVPSGNILYVTFDHPIFKLAGLEAILEAWRELEPRQEGPEYLFLDEAQFVKDFGTWTKHQVDFFKHRRIVFTGSAVSLIGLDQESGVGRWHELKISTLSFYEYIKIKKISLPEIPTISNFSELFSYTPSDFSRISSTSQILIGHFHEYLCRGGFPQTALVESISQAQRLLREDIIDKVLKRDMTILFGVRRVFELEQMFIYLCMHDGGLQEPITLSNNLGVSKPTVLNYIELLESTHLIYRLFPYGYGKEVLRGKYKIYLADPAIAPSILMKGKTLIEDSKALGNSAETAVFTHLSAHSYTNHNQFSYWRDKKEREVDLILKNGNLLIPFEVKYQDRIEPKDVLGLREFCHQNALVKYGYVLTKSFNDIGLLGHQGESSEAQIMRIPSAIFCYWLGESEILQKNLFCR